MYTEIIMTTTITIHVKNYFPMFHFVELDSFYFFIWAYNVLKMQLYVKGTSFYTYICLVFSSYFSLHYLLCRGNWNKVKP